MAHSIAAAPCPHELRPGTTVCLHCRRVAREAASTRTKNFIAKLGLGAIILGVCGAIGVASAKELRNNGAERLRELAGRLAPSATQAVAAAIVTPAPVDAAFIPVQPDSAAIAAGLTSVPAWTMGDSARLAGAPDSVLALPAAPAASVEPTPAAMVPPAPSPIVAEGETALADSMLAVRRGDVVTVRFDTQLARTRRADKFEQIVRLTLPRIHGALADSILARLPVGDLARHGDLLTELPFRGIRLDGPNGVTLTIWPETRPGQSGPLVVAYRTTVTH